MNYLPTPEAIHEEDPNQVWPFIILCIQVMLLFLVLLSKKLIQYFLSKNSNAKTEYDTLPIFDATHEHDSNQVWPFIL